MENNKEFIIDYKVITKALKNGASTKGTSVPQSLKKNMIYI